MLITGLLSASGSWGAFNIVDSLLRKPVQLMGKNMCH